MANKKFFIQENQLKIPLPREHFSRHHFWKIDKTHSLLTRIDLYVSCGPNNYINRFLGPYRVFFIWLSSLRGGVKSELNRTKMANFSPPYMFFWNIFFALHYSCIIFLQPCRVSLNTTFKYICYYVSTYGKKFRACWKKSFTPKSVEKHGFSWVWKIFP